MPWYFLATDQQIARPLSLQPSVCLHQHRLDPTDEHYQHAVQRPQHVASRDRKDERALSGSITCQVIGVLIRLY
jgi:hypothetical protein